MGITIDEADPQRVAVLMHGAVNDDEVRAVFAAVERGLDRGVPFGLFVDTRGGAPFTAAQRAMIVEQLKRTASATERLLVQVLVIESAVVRAVYYAISWAFPMGFPSKVFTEPEPARAWLELQLRNKERETRASPAA